MQRATRGSAAWLAAVDRLIVLTEFGRQKFIAGGLPAEKLVVKPNFVPDPGAPLPMAARNGGALFVGRLSVEKGVDDLLAAWRDLPELPLDIIGDGPEAARLSAMAPANVRFLGWRRHDEVTAELARARLLVFPSRWYEGLPMSLLEAMAAGTPVVAAGHGAPFEMLAAQPFARLFEPRDSVGLTQAVRAMLAADPGPASAAARAAYLARYTPEANMARLEDIYLAALETRQSARQA